MRNALLSLSRSAAFALWSLRRRASQVVPVAVALFLLVCAVQIIGAVHDISSVLTQQQIARSWRGSYDLLVRPQSAVSQLERGAGWIDPQSNLETYGGINTQQVASIQALGHVVQVVPFATMGWQSVEVLLPVELPQMGVYRISAAWDDKGQVDNEVIRYVDVTDLSQLTTEVPITHPVVQHVLARDDTTPVVFTMSVQAIQAVIGVPTAQLANLREQLLEGLAPVPALHLALHVARLRGDLSLLPSCAMHSGDANCWQLEQVQQGPISYLADGVQLLHYARARYSASAQQLAAGQVSLTAPGNDVQGPIYRLPLPGSEDASAQASPGNPLFEELTAPALLPFSMPEHLPLLMGAVRFVPLEQACAANGGSCYSGLYVRLNGVERYSQQSLMLLQATAAAIVAQTGLHVDILDGSSWRSVSVEFSQSTSTAQSMWRVLGVAVQIVHGVDGLQEMLLILCSVVCLLAIGAAGVLVGVGRRKEALLLQQLGWQRYIVAVVFTLDALVLCAPGCVLSVGWIVLVTKFWPSSLPPILMWLLLGISVIIYGSTLVRGALSGTRENRNRPVGAGEVGRGEGPLAGALWRFSPASRARLIGLFVCGLATACAVFLIAVGYVLMSGFNSELVVTILGRQVSEALEGPQLALLVVLISAALLTVALCTRLLLLARREELRLLSMVGWERRDTLLRIMRDGWLPALLSGAAGTLLALAIAASAAAFPSLPVILALLLCGPLLGMLLVSLPTIGIAWQETGRVYVWK